MCKAYVDGVAYYIPRVGFPSLTLGSELLYSFCTEYSDQPKAVVFTLARP